MKHLRISRHQFFQASALGAATALALPALPLATVVAAPSHEARGTFSATAQGYGEWPAYGRDPGVTGYSPLNQINRSNVSQLAVAWTHRTGELATYGKTGVDKKAAFEARPIMVEGILYFSTPTNQVIALDAATGTRRWKSDPKLYLTKNYSEITARGVATWADTAKAPGTLNRRRIFVGTIDGRLIALDAATGKPREDFGNKGVVDLRIGVDVVDEGRYQVTSPPAVIGDLVVISSAIGVQPCCAGRARCGARLRRPHRQPSLELGPCSA